MLDTRELKSVSGKATRKIPISLDEVLGDRTKVIFLILHVRRESTRVETALSRRGTALGHGGTKCLARQTKPHRFVYAAGKAERKDSALG